MVVFKNYLDKILNFFSTSPPGGQFYLLRLINNVEILLSPPPPMVVHLVFERPQQKNRNIVIKRNYLEILLLSHVWHHIFFSVAKIVEVYVCIIFVTLQITYSKPIN